MPWTSCLKFQGRAKKNKLSRKGPLNYNHHWTKFKNKGLSSVLNVQLKITVPRLFRREGEERGQGRQKTKNKEMVSALQSSPNSRKKGTALDNGAFRSSEGSCRPVLAGAFQKCNSLSATETKDIQNNFETFCQRGSLAQFLGIHLSPWIPGWCLPFNQAADPDPYRRPFPWVTWIKKKKKVCSCSFNTFYYISVCITLKTYHKKWSNHLKPSNKKSETVYAHNCTYL